MFKIILIFYLLFSQSSHAEKGNVTGFEIPRFVSLKSNEINLRVGPSINYPINIKYVKKNLPIEVIDEFDVWRKIRDHQNNTGWIKKGLLKGDRYVLTGIRNNEAKIFNRPRGRNIGIIKKNNILKLETCLRNWCYISHQNITGWLSKDDIWGVYNKEIYNIKFYQPLVSQYWKILDRNWFK
jgi:SH3-like domain-containing protein